MTNMVQYGVTSDCCNNCAFCLRMNRKPMTKEEVITSIRSIRENMKYVDWKHKFSAGISLLGGEIYFYTDPDIQEEFMLLIEDVINKVLLVSTDPNVKYSTVTNGLYDPAFLFRVIDRIVERVGLDFVDVNFSYDLKYRYASEDRRLLALSNIQKFIKRYNYCVGVQMILTQYVIDMVNSGAFDIQKFLDNDIKGGMLCFLYPHAIHTGKQLDDFQFKRNDFIQFMLYLRDHFPSVFTAFVCSSRNSAVFKYTGYRDKHLDITQQPVLSDGKEIINKKCGHSQLYSCYADSDKCFLCDLEALL